MSEYIEFVRHETEEEKGQTIAFTAMHAGLVIEITTTCDGLHDSYAVLLESQDALTLREFFTRVFGGK